MTSTKISPCSAPALGTSGPRPSKVSRIRAAFLIGIHLLFALHLADLYLTGSSITPLEPSESMEYSKDSVVNAGLIFFALLILSTLLLGRFFCGWGCHLVALQDWCRALLVKIGITPKPLRSRLLAFVPFLAAFYMFFLPYLARLWVGVDVSTQEVHLSTDPQGFWSTFPGWTVSLSTFAVCGFAAVYVLGSKGFCTYACPYGALFGAVDRIAPGRIRVTDACEGCGHCTQVCTSNVAVSKEVREYGMVMDAGCMKCLDCISVCPKDALYFGFGKPALFARARNAVKKRASALPWGQEIFLAVMFAAAFFAVRGLWVTPDERIPFLMALGIAGCSAGLALVLLRMAFKPKVQLQNLKLKEGSWTGRGKGIAAGIVALLALLAHSGYVRWHDWHAEGLTDDLHAWKTGYWAPDRPELDAETRAKMEELRDRSLTVRAASLMESPLNAGRLAWAYQWLGDEEAVEPMLDEGLERHPRDGFLHYLRGQRRLRQGKPQEATASFVSGAELRPDMPILVGVASETLFQSGQPEQALLLLDEGIRYQPQSVPLRINRAFLLTALGLTDQADGAFADAVGLAPQDMTLRSRWAQVRFSAGNIEGALTVLREGVSVLPENPDSHGFLADALLSAGQAQEALEVIEEALRLAPERPDLLQVRANARRALGLD